MSLYDDDELDVGSSGWTPGGMKLLQTHVQLKKANKGNKNKHQPRVAPVVDLKSAREFGFAFPKAAGLPFLKNTREPKGSAAAYAPASLIYSDLPVPIVDEYDPLRPNDYDKAVKELRTREEEKRAVDDRNREKDRGDRDRRRSEKDRDRDRDRDKDKDKDRDRERDRGRHEKDRERERERDRDREKDRRRTREDSPSNGLRSNNTEGFCRVRGESDDEDEEPRGGSSRDRARKDRAGAMIAPPPSLQEKEGGGGGGGSSSGGGSGLAFAAKIMAKYGYREGQGLGKHEHGISTALQVEKTSRRGGRIIGEKAIMPPPSVPLPGGGFGGTPAGPSSAMDESVPMMPPPPPPGSMPPPPPPGLPGLGVVVDDKKEDESNITEIMKHPAKVVLLRNMVGPGEVDGDLEPEVKEECAGKYGEVLKVIIFEMPERPADEAVRIFVEFRRMEAAIKAVVDLNGRFFGGRQVKAGFYDQHKFNNLQLAD